MGINHPIIAAAFIVIFTFAIRGRAEPGAAPPPAEPAEAQPRPPVQDGIARLPHIEIDLRQRELRIAAEVIEVDMPLEFFCVVKHLGPEHETVLRTEARPSHVHLGLLMLGLQPGQPLRFSEAMDRWQAPHGPPLHLSVEYEREGRRQRVPAHRWMRNVETKRTAPPFTFVFVGSQLLEDGTYAADATGYIVSVVNFDMTVIDVPELASSADELLEWETNVEAIPPAGTEVTLIIEPAGDAARPPADGNGANAVQRPADAADAPQPPLVDEQRLAELRRQWEEAVTPHRQALREAAQTHYEVVNALRREQQRLIDEADRIHRLIEQLERQYQDMTTPRPEPID